MVKGAGLQQKKKSRQDKSAKVCVKMLVLTEEGKR